MNIIHRITLVNLGLWRYCYDDQLYDLIEVINPQFSNLGETKVFSELTRTRDISYHTLIWGCSPKKTSRYTKIGNWHWPFLVFFWFFFVSFLAMVLAKIRNRNCFFWELGFFWVFRHRFWPTFEKFGNWFLGFFVFFLVFSGVSTP